MTITLVLLLLWCPCPVKRDRQGNIQRDWAALYAFKKATGYPRGRPGYVVDHVMPLCACGADHARNMAWARVDSAKAKDKLEIEACMRLGRKRQ
jgi:hypothetical protein